MTIEWFRVINRQTRTEFNGDASIIVCRECLTEHKLTLLNRVFGASQTCDKCRKSDVSK